MDFSKIKKIFYIICIISMLLSIKSKVFGASYDFSHDNVDYNINIPDWITDNNLNYSFYIYDLTSPRRHEFNLLVYSSSSIKLNDVSYDNSRIYFTGDNIFLFSYGQEGNSFSAFMNNVKDYLNTNVTFEFYNPRKTDHTTDTFKTNYYDSFIKETTAPIYKGNDIILDTTITTFNAPFFDNITEIENGYPDGVFISPGDFTKTDSLYFHLLKITNTVPDGNQSTYYYDSKVFKLTKDSKYYKTYVTDSNIFYYFIDRSALTLDTDSSYLYVLSNSGDSISNSYGILQPDIPGGVYDVVQSDTAGVITEQQALNDKMANINNNQQDLINNSNNINNFLNENTVSTDTETDVDTNLNFNNSSPQFSALQTNFISRLTSIVADFGNYSLDTVDTINIPVPYSNNTISLKSDLMTSHIPNDIKFIINAFWCFIFGKYFLNYLLLIYKLITTGQLIDYYSSNDEIIVTDVL